MFFEILRSGAVADQVEDHTRHRPVAGRYGFDDGSAGWCNKLATCGRLIHRNALEQLQRTWRRNRQAPVGATDESAAYRQSGDIDLLDTHQIQPNTSAYDINYGIQTADFMQMNIILVHSMHGAFGRGEMFED